jgi:hypothetical protein
MLFFVPDTLSAYTHLSGIQDTGLGRLREREGSSAIHTVCFCWPCIVDTYPFLSGAAVDVTHILTGNIDSFSCPISEVLGIDISLITYSNQMLGRMFFLLSLFAPDSIFVMVELKFVRPDYPNLTCVERPVAGAALAIIIFGVRVETGPLVRRMQAWGAATSICPRISPSGKSPGPVSGGLTPSSVWMFT